MKKIQMPSFSRKNEYCRLKIVPDSSARNWRTEEIITLIAEQYKIPFDRTERKGILIKGIKEQETTSFEISFENEKVCFYLIVTKNLAPIFQRKLMSVWDKASVEIMDMRDDETIYGQNTVIHQLDYKKHDLYSLHTDAKDNAPLNSIFEAGRLIDYAKKERASVFAHFEPIHQVSWRYEIDNVWNNLRKGISPKKVGTSFRDIMLLLGQLVANVLQETVLTLSEIASDGKSESNFKKQSADPEASKFAIEMLTNSTKQKKGKQALKTYIYTFAESEDKSRAELISRSLALAFNELSGDNELKVSQVSSKTKIAEIKKLYHKNEKMRINIRANMLSTSECAKLVQIAGKELQDLYAEIDRLENTQIEVTKKSLLNDAGLLLGDITYRGKTHNIYAPKSNVDELVLPHIGVGGMGQGKTNGLLANFLYEVVEKGYGGVLIDPAKKSVSHQFRTLVEHGVLDEDKFVHLDLGRVVFALDFCEALRDENGRTRLANTLSAFFNIADETTGQTERFLRAAVMSMETAKLQEIMDIFEEDTILDKAVQRLKDKGDKFNLKSLEYYKAQSVARRQQITAPIYNRFNAILGDEHLARCMESDNSLDFIDILCEKKAYVIDCSTADLDATAIDIIVSLVSLKIDVAMRLRAKVKGLESETPFFVLLDEPHQFIKSTKLWTSAIVESRKFKVGYFYTIHHYDQLPIDFQKSVRSALPHYHIYASSPNVWKALKDELAPFNVNDVLKLKTYHTITVMRAEKESVKPFIMKMTKPPITRFLGLPTI